VFINAELAKQNSTVTFFVDWDETVTVTTTLDGNAPYYYTISGGYVDGKVADLIVPAAKGEKTFQDNALINDLLGDVKNVNGRKATVFGDGILKIVNLTNDLVVKVTDVDTTAKELVKDSKVFAIQLEKKFDDATSSVAAVKLDGGTYTVADDAIVVNEATNKETIDSIIKDYKKNPDNYGNVYIVYEQGKRDLIVSEIFIASPVEVVPVVDPEVEVTVKKVTMDPEKGPEIVMNLTKGGEAYEPETAAATSIKVLNKDGEEVRSNALKAALDGDTLTITADTQLTANKSYKAIVNLTIDGKAYRVETKYFEAQPAAGSAEADPQA